MSNRIYDSSQLIKRKAEQAIAGSFLTRIGPPNNTTGYGPLPGIYDSSVMNAVKTGHMTEYTRYPTCVGVSPGCPSCVPTVIPGSSIPIPPTPTNYGWIAFIFGASGSSENVSAETYGIVNGSIFITGQFFGTVTLYDATTTGSLTARTTITSAATNPNLNAFIAKYDTNGIFQWVTTLTTSGTASGLSMTSDSSNIYVTGSFKADLNVYNGSSTGPIGSPVLTLTNTVSGSSGGFLLSYNLAGTLQWGTKFINTITSITLQSRSITILGTDLYIGGIFTTGVNLYNAGNQSIFPASLVSNSTTIQGFLIKYNISGFTASGNSATVASPATVFPSPVTPAGITEIYSVASVGTNIYVCGFFTNPAGISTSRSVTFYKGSTVQKTETATMTPGTKNGFIAKYDTNCDYVSSTLIRNSTSDAIPLSITVSSANIFVTGYFGASVTFPPSPPPPSPPSRTVNFSSFGTPSSSTPTASLTATTVSASFIVSYKISDGTVEWVNLIGGDLTSICFSNTINYNGSSDNSIYVITTQAGATGIQLYNANGVSAPTATISIPLIYGYVISKYTATGQLTWATKIESSFAGLYLFSSNIMLTDNDMYVTSILRGQSVFYDANGLSGPSSTPFLSFTPTPAISPPSSTYTSLAKYNNNTGKLTN